MKPVSIRRLAMASLLVAAAGCSSHPVKCHGSLRPINHPAVGASVVPPGTGRAPSDTHATARDSHAAVPDSHAAAPDSHGAPPPAPPAAHRDPRSPVHPEPHL